METSAVAYFFGKKLHQELGIPVGIIQRAYAGTPIEGWLPWDVQKNDPRSKAQKKLLEDTASRMAEKRGETAEKAIAAFHSELAIYNAKIDAGETMKNKFRQLAPPIITRPATLGHQFPENIFNAMVAPVTPFGIRGIVWYQGERNSKNVPQALDYQNQLETLVNFYRKAWHQNSNGNMPKDFPVQITQLPSWHAPQSAPSEGIESPWVINRESMRLATRNLPNTHMAVSIDTGDAIALHPKNKKPIGIRHAIIALKNTYGKCSVGEGPQYIAHKIEKGEILIEFGSIGSGLQPARPEPLTGFAIAGSDHQWHWAEAKITGNTVIVSSANVLEPVAVRYAWAMNPSQRNLLYNKEGLPASPFRTDNWQLYNPEADIVEVTKPEKPSGYIPQDWNRPVMKP
jgi:sialate O-acetylesterase